MIFKLFTAHPASVNETYGEHLRFASGTGFRMVLGGLACMCHGVLPFLFTTTGSRTIIALHEKVSSGARAPVAERIKGERKVEERVAA